MFKIVNASSGMREADGDPSSLIVSNDTKDHPKQQEDQAEERGGADDYPHMNEKQKKLFELRLKMVICSV